MQSRQTWRGVGMGAARTIAALVAIVASATLIAGAAAGRSSTAVDLSTRAAVDSYLTSIGVNPATVVRQAGRLNYAGPHCPGAAWTCTTATRVVQAAPAGGRNQVDCPDSDETCVVVQSGAHNKAECRQRTTSEPVASLKCSITQQGKTNFALVHQTIEQRKGPAQDAREVADIRQHASEKNELQLVQLSVQLTFAGPVQEQDGHTVAELVQTATGHGKNVAQLRQIQELAAAGAATRQRQNSNPLPHGLADCATEGNGDEFSPTQPNVCADVRQETHHGTNENELDQRIGEHAATALSGSQQQGLAKRAGSGGIDGEVDQTTASGSSRNDADQEHRQHAAGPAGATQAQYIDPGCCGVSQRGAKSSEKIDQVATQSATSSNAFQSSRTVGVSHTPGSCRIKHRARNNSDSQVASASEPGPCALVLITVCTSGGHHLGTQHDKGGRRGKCETVRGHLPRTAG